MHFLQMQIFTHFCKIKPKYKLEKTSKFKFNKGTIATHSTIADSQHRVILMFLTFLLSVVLTLLALSHKMCHFSSNKSFKRSSTVRFMGSVSNIYQCKSEVNEVSRGRYNNNNYKGGYNKGNHKGKNDYYGKKDWNKNTKGSYQKKEDRKESKDKDVYLTLKKMSNFAVLQDSMRTFLPAHAE